VLTILGHLVSRLADGALSIATGFPQGAPHRFRPFGHVGAVAVSLAIIWAIDLFAVRGRPAVVGAHLETLSFSSTVSHA
jgi:hypothetical protein